MNDENLFSEMFKTLDPHALMYLSRFDFGRKTLEKTYIKSLDAYLNDFPNNSIFFFIDTELEDCRSTMYNKMDKFVDTLFHYYWDAYGNSSPYYHLQEVTAELSRTGKEEDLKEYYRICDEIHLFANEMHQAYIKFIKLGKLKTNEYPKTQKSLMLASRIKAKKIEKSDKKKIFISYSHEDEKWLTILQKHLNSLLNIDDSFEYWDDTRIKAGDRWKEEIENNLQECKIAILLISAAFLASDFINKNELPPILSRVDNDGVRILPVIVSSSLFKESQLNCFQAFNNPDEPLDLEEKPKQEKLLVDLAREIKNQLL